MFLSFFVALVRIADGRILTVRAVSPGTPNQHTSLGVLYELVYMPTLRSGWLNGLDLNETAESKGRMAKSLLYQPHDLQRAGPVMMMMAHHDGHLMMARAQPITCVL